MPLGSRRRRLVVGDLDDVEDFVTRMNILHLLGVRGRRSDRFGGRVRLYPHQLYVAERASAIDPVRWCSLTKWVSERPSRRRSSSTGCPLGSETWWLTVQWLGSSGGAAHWCSLLARIADVKRDFGDASTPSSCIPAA